jgi:hypothetical protein
MSRASYFSNEVLCSLLGDGLHTLVGRVLVLYASVHKLCA